MGKVDSVVRLKDEYTSQANRIAESSSRMSRAIHASAKRAQQAGGALKTAFDRSYEIKVKDLNLSKHRASVYRMDDALKEATGKKYEVKITARNSVREQAEKTFNGIKSSAQSAASSVSSSFSRMKVNTQAFLSARKDAKSLQDELKRMTGRRHRVSLQVSGQASIIDRISAKLKSLTSRRHKIGVDVQGGSGGLGGILGKGLKLGGAALVGGAALLGGGAISKGFGRLSSIEGAEAKMRGFGYNEGEVSGIMDNVQASVKGTQFGLGEGAVTAAGAVAAGIKPGAELEGMLKTVANSAAAAGIGMDEMGSIFNKAATSGKAHNDVLQQVSDRGIPIYAKLAETMGVSQDKIFDMAASGEVSFKDFEIAMAAASGNVAAEMANTFEGAKANLGAAMGRIGANLLGGAFDKLTPTILAATEWISGLEEPAAKLGDKIGELASGAFAWIRENSEQIGTVFAEIGGVVGPLLKGAFSIIGAIATSVVIPALQILGGVVKDVVWPAFSALAGVVSGYVMPFLSKVADVIGGLVIPVLSAVAGVISGVFTGAVNAATSAINLARRAFDGIKSAVSAVARGFNRVKGAVDSAISALGGIGKRIGGALNSLNPFGRGGAVATNASGTTYHSGGLTRLNELGGEALGGIWNLPEGAKVYPSGKTTEMIKKEIITPNQGRSDQGKVVHLNTPINIYCSDAKGGKKIGAEVERRLRRLAVTI